MELTQLRYVLQLASTSNFSKAADRLYITQPALSQQINVLEEELGLKLFRRTTRKVTLTETGEEFVRGARESWIGWRNSSAQWRCAAGR